MTKQSKSKRIIGSGCITLLLVMLGIGGYLLNSMASRNDLVPVGDLAPAFSAAGSDGNTVSLATLKGKKVVLVFYPGDNTPVCTAQLCAIRDSWGSLQSANAVVFGVNPANQTKHADFASKYKLPFPLIVDEDGAISRAYGCRAIFGIVKRTVYVIDEHGKVVWAKRGNPDPETILRAIKDAKSS